MLSNKVRQFEEKVAREEMLMRNNLGVGEKTGAIANEDILDAQTQVNDQYIKAIEAKLQILDKL